jgi:predicted TPR repeat methyltransferase
LTSNSSDEDGLARTFTRIAAMSPEAVLAIFRRYGRPLAVEMPPAAADDHRAVVARPDGVPATVRVLQVMGYGDVIPNDYFVLEIAGQEPVAVAGPFFSSALEALARAAGVA